MYAKDTDAETDTVIVSVGFGMELRIKHIPACAAIVTAALALTTLMWYCGYLCRMLRVTVKWSCIGIILTIIYLSFLDEIRNSFH